jgi:hypothetical protein
MKLCDAFLLLVPIYHGAAFAPRSSVGGPLSTVGGFRSTDSCFRAKPDASKLTRFSIRAEINPEEFMGQECIITPEGFGFSSRMERVLKNSGRSGGYYRARSSDIVTDVMEGITNGSADVALVYDDKTDKLAGIFTETDYIKVSQSSIRHCRPPIS